MSNSNSWATLSTENSGEGAQNKSNYMKLDRGQHIIRILDAIPFTRWAHWIPPTGEHKGMTVNCLGRGNCPVCAVMEHDKENGIKSRYNTRKLHAFNVIDKKKGELAIIDKGNTLINAIKNVASVAGEPTSYDIQLVIGQDSKGDPTYTPIPMVPAPLTPNEVTLAANKQDFSTYMMDVETMIGLMEGRKLESIAKNETPTTETLPDVDFTNK